MVPIPSYIEDPMYRYKMPTMKLKVEGSGNGIKTNLINLHEVANALRVPTEYPLRFMGHENGSQVIFKNEGKMPSSIIKGSFISEQLVPCQDKFIEKYVLCQKCKLPELVIYIEKDIVYGRCNGCGHDSKLDNKHKLATFIVKNPPENRSDLKKENQKDKIKKGEKKEKMEKGEKGDKGEKKKKKTKKAVDEEEEVMFKALKEKITKEEPLEIEGEVMAEVTDFFRTKFINLKADNIGFEEISDSLYAKLKNLKIDKANQEKYGFIIFSTCFGINIAKEIKDNSKVLEAFFSRAHRIKFMKYEVLLILQHFLLKKFAEEETFLKKGVIGTILNHFYEAEIFDKEYLVGWKNGKHDEILVQSCYYEKELDTKFKDMAMEFLEYLEEDGDEDDSEEDEEEEEEVEGKGEGEKEDKEEEK